MRSVHGGEIVSDFFASNAINFIHYSNNSKQLILYGG